MLAPVQWNTRQFVMYIGMLTGIPSTLSHGGLCGMSVCLVVVTRHCGAVQ